MDERRELDRETEDVVDETGDVVDETEGVVDETEGVVEYRETEIVNITQTLIENWRQKGIYNDILAGLPADAGHEEQLQLILDNYVTILERAREHSDTEFVAVYEGLQRLERS